MCVSEGEDAYERGRLCVLEGCRSVYIDEDKNEETEVYFIFIIFTLNHSVSFFFFPHLFVALLSSPILSQKFSYFLFFYNTSGYSTT